MERAIKELGLKGVKIYPAGFSPIEARIQPFLQKVNDLETPALFHQGSSFPPCLLEDCCPAYLELLADRYPKMKIIGAHIAKGWEEVMVGVILYRQGRIITDTAARQRHEYLLSPWSFTLRMRYLMDTIPDSVAFGSDWPFTKNPPSSPTYKEWVDALRNLKIPEPVQQLGLAIRDFTQEEKDKILGDNAKRFLAI